MPHPPRPSVSDSLPPLCLFDELPVDHPGVPLHAPAKEVPVIDREARVRRAPHTDPHHVRPGNPEDQEALWLRFPLVGGPLILVLAPL